MISFRNEEKGAEGGQQEHEQKTITNRPQTVSSFSSIDSAGYEQNDIITDSRSTQQSSLPSLPSLMVASGSSTVVTTSSADTSFGLTTNNSYIGASASTSALEPESQTSSNSSGTGTGSLQISSSTGVLVASTPNTNTVPEFLYQLTKMLTDNNRDIIEWSNGKIEVHSPHKLETHVLNRYFRHSKFASFQRQLNYFGFRKLAGKGKMAPCSYINDATTDELGSLLLIKRKQGNEPKSKSGGKKRDRSGKETKARGSANSRASCDPVNPVLAGILYRSSGESGTVSTSSTNGSTLQQSQKAIARVAVGKGVRHGFVPHQTKSRVKSVQSSSHVSGCQQVSTTHITPPVQASLNALTQNFNQSMHETSDITVDTNGEFVAVAKHQDVNQYQVAAPAALPTGTTGRVSYVPGSLHRDDSLVDLAMIPIVGDGTTSESNVDASSGFSFVDFPFDPNIFSSEDPNI
mmetsp:Transcript_23619/g.55963  ORF Transcript_23619/g.55963 Transcript_23619/m.55963 type:complete len:462 (-) Transcript_23619:546-1931(-)|eukprot:CAMPEP_0197184808 /NCGR_PEP_ID=MMETSP1423-20130617/10626_1 /TAXON_ID=476441 /ORGANISM="Pseudo-nitzschia heimii, Strain UNC1101" /LENGTH=461 /DNA_ID=CAMNT_0042635723 /DNA_START=91 /DNA_END=1476 /DNA_ORIENTATION=+